MRASRRASEQSLYFSVSATDLEKAWPPSHKVATTSFQRRRNIVAATLKRYCCEVMCDKTPFCLAHISNKGRVKDMRKFVSVEHSMWSYEFVYKVHKTDKTEPDADIAC